MPSRRTLASLLVSGLLWLHCAPTAKCSQYDPHLPGSTASSFEGWFIRMLTQPGAAATNLPSSVILLVGAMPRGSPNHTFLVSVVVHAGSPESPPEVFSHEGAQLHVTSGSDGSQPVTSDPDFSSPPAFRLQAADGSLLVHMQGEHCQVHAHLAGVSLIAQCTGPPLPWSASGQGPEGPAAAVPAFLSGLHWFVHSLATPMRYSLVRGSQPPVHAAALAHMEKNWGRSFPPTWHWAQGLDSVGSDAAASAAHTSSAGGGAAGSGTGSPAAPAVRSAFALAGGKPPGALVPAPLIAWMPNLWLLGVRAGNRSWDFHPWDSYFSTQVAPCGPEASLLLTATQLLSRRRVELQISAPRTSFAELECPTEQGFRLFSEESLTATATVRLYEYHGWAQKQQVAALDFDNVALEFGGEARCPIRQPTVEPAGMHEVHQPTAVA